MDVRTQCVPRFLDYSVKFRYTYSDGCIRVSLESSSSLGDYFESMGGGA